MSKKLKIPKFKTDKKLFDFLVQNKRELIQQKKRSLKRAKSNFDIKLHSGKVTAKNEVGVDNENNDKFIERKCVINSCGILDSHRDVHIPKLWNNSLKQNTRILHVQEHKSNSFKHIISSGDDLEVYTKTYTWKELGLDIAGKTEVLEFNSTIRNKRNKFMYKQYRKGYVNEHSVGMYYVKIVLCINDPEYGAEYEAYEKYEKYIVNKDDIDRYFWAVTEAKVIEGSAVPSGSNPITPTLNNKSNNKSKKRKKRKKNKKSAKSKKDKALIKWLEDC